MDSKVMLAKRQKSKNRFATQRIKSEAGLGTAGALGAVAAICFVWFIWNTIMDGIGSHHQAKVKKRRAWFESLKPKKPKKIDRKVRGYKVKY